MCVAARTNMKHVMPARAVARQFDLDANERIRIVKHVELKMPRFSTPSHRAFSALA
jgi:hypothetical protein